MRISALGYSEMGTADKSALSAQPPDTLWAEWDFNPPDTVRFPAIAETDEEHQIETIWEARCFTRRQGEPLHPDREPLDTLDRIRRTIGEYYFAGQYQQSPAPLGGGLVKAEWFKRYRENERPERFDRAVAGKFLVAAWFGGGRDRLIATMPVKTAFDQRDRGRGLASGVLA